MIRGNRHRAAPSSAAAGVLLAGALALTGCTSGSTTPTPSPRTADATAAARGATGAASVNPADGEDFGYPLIAPTPSGETVLVSASMRTGVAQLAMTPPTEGAMLTIQVACRGEGTIDLGISMVGYDRITCRPSGDAFEKSTVRVPTYATGGAAPTLDARSFSVGVTADKRQQWAITVSERLDSAATTRASASPTARR